MCLNLQIENLRWWGFQGDGSKAYLLLTLQKTG